MVINFRPAQSRWLANLNASLCYLWWYGFFAWFTFLKVIVRSYKLDRAVNIRDFIYLAFWVGANPACYYYLKLQEHRREDWLLFVYPKEQAHWQTIQAAPNSSEEVALLLDKQAFSNYCLDNGVNAVAEFGTIDLGETVRAKNLFKQQDFFLKPVNANAMRGCMSLEYRCSSYRLHGWSLKRELVDEQDTGSILRTLQRVVDKHSLLIQPLLRNHTKMLDLSSQELQTTQLSTLRIITSVSKTQGLTIEFAVLEVLAPDERSWYEIIVDVNSGYLDVISCVPELADECAYLIQPFWTEIQCLVYKAHELFIGIPTVAWDLAITNDGLFIIEGNWGWSPLSIQTLTSTPLLASNLLQVYSEQG